MLGRRGIAAVADVIAACLAHRHLFASGVEAVGRQGRANDGTAGLLRSLLRHSHPLPLPAAVRALCSASQPQASSAQDAIAAELHQPTLIASAALLGSTQQASPPQQHTPARGYEPTAAPPAPSPSTHTLAARLAAGDISAYGLDAILLQSADKGPAQLHMLLAGLSQALVPSLNAAAERRRYDAVRTALTLLRHANAALQPSQHTSKPQAALANSGIGGRLLATQCAALLQGVLAELRSSRPHTGADSLGLGPGDWAALVTSLSAYPNTKGSREEAWQVLYTHLTALTTLASLRMSQDWDGWEGLISALSAVPTRSVPDTCVVPVLEALTARVLSATANPPSHQKPSQHASQGACSQSGPPKPATHTNTAHSPSLLATANPSPPQDLSQHVSQEPSQPLTHERSPATPTNPAHLPSLWDITPPVLAALRWADNTAAHDALPLLQSLGERWQLVAERWVKDSGRTHNTPAQQQGHSAGSGQQARLTLPVVSQLVEGTGVLAQQGWLQAGGKRGLADFVLDTARPWLLRLDGRQLVQLCCVARVCETGHAQLIQRGDLDKRQARRLGERRQVAMELLHDIAAQIRPDLKGLSNPTFLALLWSLSPPPPSHAVNGLSFWAQAQQDLIRRARGVASSAEPPTLQSLQLLIEAGQILSLHGGQSVQPAVASACVEVLGRVQPDARAAWLSTVPSDTLADMALACAEAVTGFGSLRQYTKDNADTHVSLFATLLNSLASSGSGAASTKLAALASARVLQLLHAWQDMSAVPIISPASQAQLQQLGPVLLPAVAAALVDRAAAADMRLPELLDVSQSLLAAGLPAAQLPLPDILDSWLQTQRPAVISRLASGRQRQQQRPGSGLRLADVCDTLKLIQTWQAGLVADTAGRSSDNAPVHAALTRLVDSCIPQLRDLAASGWAGKGSSQTLDQLLQLPLLLRACAPGFAHTSFVAECSDALCRVLQAGAKMSATQLVDATTAVAHMYSASEAHSATTAALQELGWQVSQQLLADVSTAQLLRLLRAYDQAGVPCSRLRHRIAGYVQLRPRSLSPGETLEAARLLLLPASYAATAPAADGSQSETGEDSMSDSEDYPDTQRGYQRIHAEPDSRPLQPQAARQLYNALAAAALVSLGQTRRHGLAVSLAGASNLNWSMGDLLELVRVGLDAGTYHLRLFDTVTDRWLASAAPTSDLPTQYNALSTVTQANAVVQAMTRPAAETAPQPGQQARWLALAEQAGRLATDSTQANQPLPVAAVCDVVSTLAHTAPLRGLCGAAMGGAEQSTHARDPVAGTLRRLLLASAPHWVHGYDSLSATQRGRLAEAYARVPLAAASSATSDNSEQPAAAAAAAALRQLWLAELQAQVEVEQPSGVQDGVGSDSTQYGSQTQASSSVAPYDRRLLASKSVKLMWTLAAAYQASSQPLPPQLSEKTLAAVHTLYDTYRAAVLDSIDAASRRKHDKQQLDSANRERSKLHSTTLQLTLATAHTLAAMQPVTSVTSQSADTTRDTAAILAAVARLVSTLLPAAHEAVHRSKDVPLLQRIADMELEDAQQASVSTWAHQQSDTGPTALSYDAARRELIGTVLGLSRVARARVKRLQEQGDSARSKRRERVF